MRNESVVRVCDMLSRMREAPYFSAAQLRDKW